MTDKRYHADIETERGDGSLAGRLINEICDLYDSIFSAPPFVWSAEDSGHHRQMLADIIRDVTFGVTIARHHHQLVGFAYGHQLPSTHGWWGNFPDPLPEELVREWEGRTFALIDFGVAASYRGQGIGRQLHDLLLNRRTEERAVLSVQPTAVDTQRIYAHWGWSKVGRKGPIADVNPSHWDIYVRLIAPLSVSSGGPT